MTFWQWLQKQSRRRDPIGDLARDVKSDREWHKPQTFKAWRAHLIDCNACDGALQALDDAWREYDAAR